MKLFLISDDYVDFECLREVTSYEHVRISDTDVLKITVDKPVIGQKYGFGTNDIDTFYLFNKYQNDYLQNLKGFPIDVVVFIDKELNNHQPNSIDELHNIAWATLYDNRHDAEMRKI